MSFLSKLAAWAAKILLPLGGLGLFGAAAIDSSFVPLPEGVDLWLISLSILRPDRMTYYVFAATLGSLAGCAALYFVARMGEQAFLEKNPKYKGLPRVRRWVERYEAETLLVGSILPPPMPFKLVVIAAGIGKGRFDRFVGAVMVGRLFRYGVEGVLAVRYGRQAWQWLRSAGPWAFGVFLAVVAVVYLIHRCQKKKDLV